jgi:hypothetical protein
MSFPGHPKVVALLDKHIGQPLEDPLPDPPVPELLDGLLKGLNNCKKNADRRAESAREAAKIGQDTLIRARKRLERQGSIARPRSTLGDDEPKRSKIKDRDLAQRQSTTAVADLDPHLRIHTDGKNAGNSVRQSTPGTKSPAQLSKVKRELSGKPRYLSGKKPRFHATSNGYLSSSPHLFFSFPCAFGHLTPGSFRPRGYWSWSTTEEEETQGRA